MVLMNIFFLIGPHPLHEVGTEWESFRVLEEKMTLSRLSVPKGCLCESLYCMVQFESRLSNNACCLIVGTRHHVCLK